MVIFHGYVSLREGIQKVLKFKHCCIQHPLNRRAWQVESAVASSLTQRSEYRLNHPERAPLWWWMIISYYCYQGGCDCDYDDYYDDYYDYHNDYCCYSSARYVNSGYCS